MQTALENGEATLLPDDKQTRQFSYFSANYNPRTRNVTYAAPEGLNDDTVMATIMAYDAYKNGNVVGNYNISITKHTFGKNNNRNKGISYIGQ